MEKKVSSDQREWKNSPSFPIISEFNHVHIWSVHSRVITEVVGEFGAGVPGRWLRQILCLGNAHTHTLWIYFAH